MRCVKCNAVIPDDSGFCNYCGAVQNKNSGWKCSCGTENNADHAFCMKCGRPKASQEAVGDIWKCSCGAENKTDYAFCMKCGKPKASEEAVGDMWKCSCGADNNADHAFCKKCGKPKLSEDKAADNKVQDPVISDSGKKTETVIENEVVNADISADENKPAEESGVVDLVSVMLGENIPASQIMLPDNNTYYDNKKSDSDRKNAYDSSNYHTDDTLQEINESDFFVDGIDLLTSKWLCECGAVQDIDISAINKDTQLNCQSCGKPFGKEEVLRNAVKLGKGAVPVPNVPSDFNMSVKMQNAIEYLLGAIELAIIIILIVLGVNKVGQLKDLYVFKTGCLESYSTKITVEEAFESYFDDYSWSAYSMKDGNDKYNVVQFVGQNYGAKKVTVKYRRNVKDKNSQLTAYEFKIDETVLSSYDQALLLDEIYGTDVVGKAWNDAVDSAVNEYF